MSRRIVAVVVTYNRLTLLEGLVQRLREVPECDEILVIDNASTDGTGEWLEVQADVVGRTLPTNTGGAGGFHEGLRLAMERGADLAWLMDDDGRPEVTTLSDLLAVEGYDFWGPLVVDEDAPGELVFPIRLPGSAKVVRDVASATAAATEGVLEDIVIPFNGVLVTKELVARIGLPRAEFFIWGDDHEFRLRAEKAGARIGTVVEARFAHPSVGELGTPMWGGRSTYNHTPSDLKHYCMARNNLLNLATYRSPLHALAFVLKTLWFYAVTRPDMGRIRLSIGAWWAALRGDFTGHRRFLVSTRSTNEAASTNDAAATPRNPFGRETTAIVVVTHNRAAMLQPMLEGLAKLDPAPQAVIVIDNASTDDTSDVLAASALSGLQVVRSEENLGGAGGFRLGMQTAYEAGFDRIWLMDDDVIPAPDCLGVLLSHDEPLLASVREDLSGALVEKAATRFDLATPWVLRPKRGMVETTYGTRAAMPATVEVENVAFEGFMVRRDVIGAIGLPDDSFFIFYDDVDFALRARRAGFRILAVRDALMVRQLDFSQQHDLDSWKGYYMYRNLFAVHLRYGENVAVRAKPYVFAGGMAGVSLLRGNVGRATTVIRALRDARAMRTPRA
ncbi:hypothetical protein Back2_08170 [Nocardioides baekrokdamisoli]|uniref:Glycosyltransferase 2-like domain-containing protein n=1 Tax=Nocardioides baekrokdamisoli TaxID=1804624 RepID=A0A3G9IC89_9ACTN|nr:glycosyltransferase family 2 protein [Nocardioides baekrokdamisoli]BBH16530.1 hypothetical protein Back2_08170 [Nocardioides baekrokdamisoli]